MSVLPVAPIGAEGVAIAGNSGVGPTARSFAQLIRDGIANTEAKVAEADRMAKAFVLDDSIPLHQVTYALEEARLSMELMLQVRSKLIDGYQQLMNTQI